MTGGTNAWTMSPWNEISKPLGLLSSFQTLFVETELLIEGCQVDYWNFESRKTLWLYNSKSQKPEQARQIMNRVINHANTQLTYRIGRWVSTCSRSKMKRYWSKWNSCPHDFKWLWRCKKLIAWMIFLGRRAKNGNWTHWSVRMKRSCPKGLIIKVTCKNLRTS